MKCSIDGCEREGKYVDTGWCQTHYHRWWRHGDPLYVKNTRREKCSYRAAHGRVRQDRGPACDYPCVRCGNKAEQWAYDHEDPKEITEQTNTNWGPMTIAYSLDSAHYKPMCRGCHVYIDRYEER